MFMKTIVRTGMAYSVFYMHQGKQSRLLTLMHVNRSVH